ncbi:MAG: HAD-IA family hydrolase [Ktedonobacteraceae bacterium]
MIRVLLFDVDGVLANGEQFSKRLARDYDITAEMTTPFFNGPFLECLVGNADLKQELISHLKQWGWRGSVDEFLHYWFTSEHVIDETLVNRVQQLRQKGIRCYLATNQEQYRTAYILHEMGFADAFDGIFSSAYIGYMKYDGAFFAAVLHELDGVKAEEILFWDDSPGNVATAKEAGLHAELYSNFEDFQGKICKYLN